jgi:hypothetical protein
VREFKEERPRANESDEFWRPKVDGLLTRLRLRWRAS